MLDQRINFSGWVACLALSLAASARGANGVDRAIPLDALVYSSDLVVEGQIVEPPAHAAHSGANVRVTAVYRGTVKVGQTILVAWILEYRKPCGQGTSDVEVGPKDHLLMFLQKATPPPPQSGLPVGEAFAPVENWWVGGGVLLVLRGRVCNFYARPGSPSSLGGPTPPYVAATSRLPQQSPIGDSLVDLREQIRASALRAATWHAHLDAPSPAAEIPWLISLLHERYIRDDLPDIWFASDRVAEDAARNVAGLGDFYAMDRAIQANPDQARRILAPFKTPGGRDFLLGRIADRSLPTGHRQLLARLLGDIGLLHSARFPEYAGTQPPRGEKEIRNSSYITRIARLAAQCSTTGDDDVATALLQSMRRGEGRDDPEVNPDLRDAAALLEGLYPNTTTSSTVRFYIEEVLCGISQDSYDRLRSPCGAILTLVTPPDYNFEPSRAGTIAISGEYRRLPLCGQVTGAFLVLEPVGGGNATLLPSAMRPEKEPGFRATQIFGDGDWDETINLPLGFQPGRYRMHLRLMDGEKIISEGHGFETVLPQQKPPIELGAYVPWPPRPKPVQPWPRSTVVGIFLAILAVPVLLLLRAAVRSRRQHVRRRRGLCPQCAYDLHFSSDRCPECGRPVAAKLEGGMVWRCFAKMALPVLVVLFIATTVAWVRSYWISDCWIRSMPDRADSFYYSRGSVVLNLLTTEAEPGWIHERADPLVLPRSTLESGDVRTWSVCGVEYSAVSDMLIVPLWLPAAFSAVAGAFLILSLRKSGR